MLMNPTDKSILECLSTKEVIAFAALCELIKISGEDLEIHLSKESFLITRDYVRIIWPVGNPKFATITENGRRALWSSKKHMIIFIQENWLVIVGTIAAIIAAVTGIIGLVNNWKNY